MLQPAAAEAAALAKSFWELRLGGEADVVTASIKHPQVPGRGLGAFPGPLISAKPHHDPESTMCPHSTDDTDGTACLPSPRAGSPKPGAP